MTTNSAYVIAGAGAAGTSGAELAWAAPYGTTGPTDATSALSTTAASEVQTVTISGTPTGGTFTLSYGGQTTAALQYNAATSAVQTALTGLSTIGSGNVAVTGTAGTTYTITFQGTMANQAVYMIAAAASLTGGTAPTIAVAQTTVGTTGWLSLGLITEDGASEDVKESTTDLRAYGVAPIVRRLVTSSEVSISVTMMQTDKVTAAIYNRLLLGSVAVSSSQFTTTTGPMRAPRYALVTELVDGAAKIRSYYPNVQVTERKTKEIKTGAGVMYGVTFTCYPDTSGNAIYTHHLVPGLT